MSTAKNKIFHVGKVGIGTDIPGEKLDVNGSIRSLANNFPTMSATFDARYDATHLLSLTVNHNSSTAQEVLGTWADSGGANPRTVINATNGWKVGISSTSPTGALDVRTGTHGFDGFIKLTKDNNFNPSIEYYRTTGSGPTWYGAQLRLMTGDFTYSYAGSSTLGNHSYSEFVRISQHGYVGISEEYPHAGLTVGKLGDYPTNDGNTYYVPEGKWSTAWNSTNAIVDNTDYWVGYTGGYLKNGCSVNISLAPNRGNTNNQSGMYISGEATGIVSADFTIGKIIGGSATGRGTSGNVRATKSELFRITSDGNIGFNRSNTTVGDSQSGNSTASPKRIVFNNDYSNGYTDSSLKLYLYNENATRQGFTSGPLYDLQYHSSGHATHAKHSFFTQNVERLRITGDGNLCLGNTHAAKKVHISTPGNQKILIDPNYNNNSGGSSNAEANANNIVESILIRTSFGENAATQTNAGHKWGIKFQGYNGNDFTQAISKCAGVFAVSEDEAGGYNRNVGLAFHTSPYNTNHREAMRINTNGIVTKPYQYVFLVSTTNHSKTANWSQITNMGIVTAQCTGVSDGTYWSNSTQRFTAPVTGVYYFYVGGWSYGNSNGSRYAYTFKHQNGNNYDYISGGNYCLVDSPMDGWSRTIKLSAGEWVELWGYSAVAVRWGGGHRFYWGGYLLG